MNVEWAPLVYNIGVGVGVLLIGIAVLALAIASFPLLRETRRLAADMRRLVALGETELRPTLVSLRESATRVDAIAADAPRRVERLDELMESAETTLASVRRTSDALGRYADVPGAGIATLAAGLRRARHVFGGGRRGDAPVESELHTEDPGP